ncbi:MAG TPA: DNA mismatch repair endonuclease MutL [Thermodesulfobacteriota bacterium]|nr:DNA mismatch repair endonuclease MutL [Thermodesulfobacteriota bacterium]
MSRKIEVLPESISQIIAAGEVIERPASVVKELMENAIDAGSSEITVELKAGGLQLIRVTDSGEGMDAEDVPLAFQRYATSKIRTAEDLYAIHTLGFRGEALPSISQVSKMTLQTRTRDSLTGTKVICEGGEIKRVSETGFPVGTEVEVERLFYNIPVKRKFLKSIRSELRFALSHFLRLSLSHPMISFRFIHDGRALHEHAKTESPLARIEAILGKEVYGHLQPVGFEQGEIKLSGFASLPSFSKRNAEGIYFYVNQRFIKDRMIYRAVLDAYRHVLPLNQFPVVILFITLPPSFVDVNVHPTKSEVKFKDPDRVYQAVLGAIRMVLEEGPSQLGEVVPRGTAEERVYREWAEPSFFSQGTLSPPATFLREEEKGILTVRDGGGLPWQAEKKWPYVVLGQIRGTYILCEGEGSLVFIDQHAAHERILFEKFKKKFENGSAISERLLLPILIELSAEESCTLGAAGEGLKEIGFEIDPVGEKVFAIRSVPSFVNPKDPKEMVRGILEDLSFSGKKGREKETVHALLVTLACHSAVRGNSMLRREEIDKLVEDLAPFHASTTCPHGRPIFFFFPLDELKKQFKRK